MIHAVIGTVPLQPTEKRTLMYALSDSICSVTTIMLQLTRHSAHEDVPSVDLHHHISE
jgi:hypothetical protein